MNELKLMTETLFIVENSLHGRLKAEGISPISVQVFPSWEDGFKGHKRKRGVYVIFDEDEIIYVGKGFFSARNKSHYDKATNKANYNPKGWMWFKENYNYSIDKWHLVLIELNSEVDITFLEGALIRDLRPIANDEVYNDR
jgi:hypothetical protein